MSIPQFVQSKRFTATMQLPADPQVSDGEAWRTKLMVTVGLLFLVPLAHVLPHRGFDKMPLERWDFAIALGMLIGFWLIMIAGTTIRILSIPPREGRWKDVLSSLAVMILPPLRPMLRPISDPRFVWFPKLGWRPIAAAAQKRMEARFNLPMICIAMLILPVLAIELIDSYPILRGADDPSLLTRFPGLELAVDLGTELIWLAFAIEFVAMISVTPNKFKYCLRHWVDIAILVLPIVSFLRALRLMQLGRLGQMSRMYRLRGLVTKLYQGLIVLVLTRRLSARIIRMRVGALERKIEDKSKELAELREELAELTAHLAEVEERTRRSEDEAEREARGM